MNGQSIGDNEAFVALIQVAEEDPEMNQRLTAILRLPEFQRKSLLGSAVNEMRMNGAPEDFILAVEALRDDAIARRALQILEKRN